MEMGGFRRALEQQDRVGKLLEEAMGPSESLRKQLHTLLEPSPAMKAIQEMIDDMNANPAHQALLEQVERINQIREPLTKKLDWVRHLHDSIRPTAMEAAEFASGLLHHRSEPVHFEAPVIPTFRPPEPVKSPAVSTLETIRGELEAEKAKKEDQRHTVVLVVYLPDKSKIIMQQMSTEDGHIVRIQGVDADTNEPRTAKVGALGFQYDLITIEHPPNLHSVE